MLTAPPLLSQWPQLDGKLLPTRWPTLVVSLSKVLLWVLDPASASTSSKLLTPSDACYCPSEPTCGNSSPPSGISPSSSNSRPRSWNTLTSTTHTSAPAKLKLTSSSSSWKPPLPPLPSCPDAPQLLKQPLPTRPRLQAHEHEWDHQGLNCLRK